MPIQPRTHPILLGLLLGSGLACNDPPSGLQERIDALVADRCALLASCECSDNPYTDPARCDFDIRASLEGAVAAAEVAGLTVDMDCIEAHHWSDFIACRLYDEVQADPTYYSESRCGSCQFVYGEREVGEPCDFYYTYGEGSDCRSGLVCALQGDTTFSCIDPCASVEGSACSGDSCGDDLFCFDNICVRGLALGEPCSPLPCARGLVCDNDTFLCRPPLQAGDPCTNMYACAHGLHCDPDGVCAPPLAAGAACGDDAECESYDCTDGHCAPRPGLGDACDYRCAEGLRCDPWSERCEPDAPFVCSLD